jgi:hypothetical protein
MTGKGFQLSETESQTDGQEENLTFINIKEKKMNAYTNDTEFSPAKAYWNQRKVLSSMRDRINALSDAVDHKTDLFPFQLAQLMSSALEFQPELIIELGRGKGNSTCGFTEVANQLRAQGLPCDVVSLCISEDWEQQTQWKVLEVVDENWFKPLTAIRGNILTFDFDSILKGVKKCLVFWDAHGFDVAECVLGKILPGIQGMENLIIMHDLSDARYIPSESSSYKEQKLWRGNDWSGPRVRLGNIDSSVEQAVAIVDFTSRNKIPFDSADHSFDVEISGDPMKMKEMQDVLGDLFNLGAHWFWFTLNGTKGPLTFPDFQAPVMNDHYEINISEQTQIMGVSLKEAVLAQPDMVEVIQRVNRYLKMEKPKLAVRIVERELSDLNEKNDILAKLGKAGSEENNKSGQIQNKEIAGSL